MIEASLDLWLSALASRPVIFFLLVVALTFVLEDATTLAVGALGAAMQVDHVLALSALLCGTIAGDALLHGLGRLAAGHPFVAARVARHGRVADAARSFQLVAAARFIPGLRLPAYLGSGVVRMPLAVFASVITVTALVWTPLLYLAPSALKAAGVGPAPVVALALLLLCTPALVRRFRRPGGMTPA